jgi:uncharacterized protein (TIGR02996 family)
MDPTLASLLRACKDEPFDDARRLVLADWLEEHGDDRAELVRLELAFERRWSVPWKEEPDAEAVYLRVQRLCRANAERWLGPARRWYRSAFVVGGFVWIAATARQLLDHPPTDLPAHVVPWLERLNLLAGPDGLDDVLVSPMLGLFSQLSAGGSLAPLDGREARLLLSNPALGRVRVLDLGNRIDADCAEAMARCDHLGSLLDLDLSHNPLTDAGAAALAQAPWLSGLSRLDLGHTHLSSAGAAALARSPRLGRLTHLSLAGIRLEEESSRLLADSPALESVAHLSLSQAVSADRPSAFRALAESPHLRPAVLDLYGVDLGEAGAAALVGGRLLERLEHLYLFCNAFPSGATVAALLGSERLAGLESLHLDDLDDDGCEVLASSGHFDHLRHAEFFYGLVGPAGAAVLGRARRLSRLASLSMHNHPLGPDGLRALAEGPGLAALRALSLTETFPDAEGVRALAGSGAAARLVRLKLSGNGLGDAGAAALSRLGAGAMLVELDLSDNGVGPEGAAALAGCAGLASLPILKLQSNRLGDEGVAAVVRSPHLTRLAYLDVSDNGLTPVGGRSLLDWPRREGLVALLVDDLGLPEEMQERVRVTIS